MASGQPTAEFVCPGHPLLDATREVMQERHQGLLRQGATLVDEGDLSRNPRVLFYLNHGIQDATTTTFGGHRIISKRVLYVEMDSEGGASHPQYAPYLDYRPLKDGEPDIATILSKPECAWLTGSLEDKAQNYAIAQVVPEHLKEVREQRREQIKKTEIAVKDRLTKAIEHWDHRANELKAQEEVGKVNANLNSGEARKRSSDLQERLQGRLERLRLENQISSLPPVILGSALIVPIGLLSEMIGDGPSVGGIEVDRQAVATKAREIVMDVERSLGYEPIDREQDKVGYDIESKSARKG